MANSEIQYSVIVDPLRVLFNEGFTQLANDVLDLRAVPLALFSGCTAGDGVTRTGIQ